MDLNSDQLLEIALDSADAGQADLPRGLEQRVLASALGTAKRVQHQSWTDPGQSQISSLSAFITTAAELGDLIGTLGPAEWASTTRVNGATVHDIVVHLLGVERYLLGQLGRRPRLSAPRREDHWPVTMLASSEMANEPSSIVADRWWHDVLGVIAACGELGPDHELSYHHLTGSLRGLLVVRTFELWTHGDDIRDATRRPLDVLDPARLSLMVNELMRVLPLGLALSGCAQPKRTARLTLTGVGGGTFDVALAPGDSPGPPDVTIAASTIDLCRLASNRLTRHEFDVRVEGDERLVEPILVGAAAFAAD